MKIKFLVKKSKQNIQIQKLEIYVDMSLMFYTNFGGTFVLFGQLILLQLHCSTALAFFFSHCNLKLQSSIHLEHPIPRVGTITGPYFVAHTHFKRHKNGNPLPHQPSFSEISQIKVHPHQSVQGLQT